MSIISRLLTSTAILGLTFFSSANAIDMSAAVEQRFKAADKDQDGKLSKTEAEKGMPRVFKNFEAIDMDKDSYVTLSEVNTAMAASKK